MKNKFKLVRAATMLIALLLALVQTAHADADSETDDVHYIDADGSPQIATATVLTGTETNLGGGWYVVAYNITFDHTISMSGEINLILADGKKMSVSPGDENADGIDFDGSLTIYGQEKQSGELAVENCNYAICGYGNDSFTLNGGKISITEGVAGITVFYGAITINRGTVNVKSADFAFASYGNVVINGGNITVETTGEGSNPINTYNSITLGLSNNANDQITISGGDVYSETNSVSIVDGQVLIDVDGHYYTGALDNKQIKALKNITLKRTSDVVYAIILPACMEITNGVTLNNGKYVAPDTEVQFKLKDGFIFTPVVTMNDVETLVADGDGVYTVTVNSNVTIEANLDVQYIDAAGSTMTANATVLTGTETNLTEGWYVVTYDITFDHTISMSDKVNLILADGKKMTVSPGDENADGFCFKNCSLTIYGQEMQSGELAVENCNSAIGGYDNASFTLNGGIISITVGVEYGITVYYGSITINRGTVNVKSAASALYGGTEGNVVINGGNITLETTGEGSNTIYAGNSITFGLSNDANDQITISGDKGCYVGKSISIAEGQMLIDGDGHCYTGTLDNEQIKALKNTTLKRAYTFSLPACMEIANGVTLCEGKYVAAGMEVKFAAKDGYEVSNVKANGNTLTADANGVYAVTISGADVEITSDVITVILDEGGLKIVKDKDNVVTATFANSAAEINITETYEVDRVELLRTFTPDDNGIYSNVTMVLPFAVKASEYNGGTFYEFGGVSNESGVWTATMPKVTGDLAANTPYIFVPSDNQLTFTFTGKVVLQTTQEIVSSETSADGWTFKGVYKRQEWGVDHGKHDYFFVNRNTTATNGADVKAGDFVGIGNNCGLNPMRCFLSYSGSDESLLKSSIVLPESIDVRFVDEVASVVEPDGSLSESDDDITTPVSEIGPASGTKVWSYDKTIYIESTLDTYYRIIDLSGRTLRASTTNSTREEVVLPGKTSGVVIVIINNKSFKILY